MGHGHDHEFLNFLAKTLFGSTTDNRTESPETIHTGFKELVSRQVSGDDTHTLDQGMSYVARCS